MLESYHQELGPPNVSSFDTEKKKEINQLLDPFLNKLSDLCGLTEFLKPLVTTFEEALLKLKDFDKSNSQKTTNKIIEAHTFIYKQYKYLKLNTTQKCECDTNKPPSQAFTLTTHPIGNIPLKTKGLMELIISINKLLIRQQIGHRPYKYADPCNYKRNLIKHFNKFKTLLSSESSFKEEDLITLSHFESSHNQIQSITKETSLEEIKEIIDKYKGLLIKLIHSSDVSTTIIDKEIQYKNLTSIAQSLKEEVQEAIIKEWGLADADGDNNPIQAVIDTPLNEDKNIQTRQSCKEKHNVPGVDTQLSEIGNIEGLAEFSDIKDLETLIQAMENKPLKDTLYQTFLPIRKADSMEDPLDLIKRIILPYYLPYSEGFVLSDFSCTETLFKLLYILNVYEEILGKKINQLFLPLREDLESIDSVSGFYETLTKEINKLNDKETLKKLLFNDNNTFRIALFGGPSDLTNEIGGQSLSKLLHAYQDQRQFNQFLKKTFNSENIQCKTAFGRGTGPRRLSFIHLNTHETTLQGVSGGDPHYGAFLRKPLGKYLTSEALHKDIVSASIKGHQKMWDPKDGEFPKAYSQLVLKKRELTSIFYKERCGNRGTRGKGNIILTFNKKRAIEANSTAVAMGGIWASSFPRKPIDDSIWEKIDFSTATSNPLLASQLLLEFFQILQLAPERAAIWGDSDQEKIDLNKLYKQEIGHANTVLTIIEKQLLKKTTPLFPEHFSERIKHILEYLSCSETIELKTAFQTFIQQMPIIIELKDMLTKELKEAKKHPNDTRQANTILQYLENFPLPPISIDINK